MGEWGEGAGVRSIFLPHKRGIAILGVGGGGGGNSYVKREREWKKDKVLHRKEISRLERDLKKATNE